jgi:hypothetical protein
MKKIFQKVFMKYKRSNQIYNNLINLKKPKLYEFIKIGGFITISSYFLLQILIYFEEEINIKLIKFEYIRQFFKKINLLYSKILKLIILIS